MQMAAHLADEAAKALRLGKLALGGAILHRARIVATYDRPDETYREALDLAGLPPETIEACFASLARGEAPACSLRGAVEAMLAVATFDAQDNADVLRGQRCAGEAKALRAVLALLTHAPPPEQRGCGSSTD